MKPVLYRYRDTESVVRAMDGYTPGEGWSPLYDEAAVQAAVDAALERAIEACQQISALQLRDECVRTADDCAAAIRALRENP